jgi:hypothetical protein
MQPRGSCASCMQAHVNFIPEHSPQYYSVLTRKEDISESTDWEVRNNKDMGNFKEEDDGEEEDENEEDKEEEQK